jgi:hypothetical protein
VDELTDEDLCWARGSVWVVSDEGRVRQHEGGYPVLADERGVTHVKGGRGTNAVLVFTDRGQAQRFAESPAFRPGLTPATFPSAEDFGAFLRRGMGRGETHVAFDPGSGGVRYVPIERVLGAIAGGNP